MKRTHYFNVKWGNTPLKELDVPRSKWTVSERFERVGAALKAHLLPLSKFDELPPQDKAEVIEYLHEADLMQAWEAQVQRKQADEDVRRRSLEKR